MSGASACTILSVRQSNDWIIERFSIPPARMAAISARANGSGGSVSSGASGDILVSMLKRTASLRAFFTSANRSARRGMRAPSAGTWSGNLPRVAGRRVEPPDVVALELGVAQRVDHRPGRAEPLAVRSARGVRHQPALVRDHHHAVARHPDVELERGHADRERARERGQRVLRREAARAAVALEVEGMRRERDAAGERGGEQRADHSSSRYLA